MDVVYCVSVCICVMNNRFECDCSRYGKGGGEPADREQTAPGDQVRDVWKMNECV